MTVEPAAPRRHDWDLGAYQARARAACFICGIVAGPLAADHHVVHRDGVGVVFLARYPVAWGQVLVAPVEHREQAVGDFTEDEYLALQRLVRRVSRAVEAAVPGERLYVLSLGSQAANAHVHWHLIRLPAGVPYPAQQAEMLTADKGWLEFDDGDLAALAAELAGALGTA